MLGIYLAFTCFLLHPYVSSIMAKGDVGLNYIQGLIVRTYQCTPVPMYCTMQSHDSASKHLSCYCTIHSTVSSINVLHEVVVVDVDTIDRRNTETRQRSSPKHLQISKPLAVCSDAPETMARHGPWAYCMILLVYNPAPLYHTFIHHKIKPEQATYRYLILQ